MVTRSKILTHHSGRGYRYRVDVALLMSLLAEADAVLRSYPVFLRVPWLTREGMRGYLHVEMYMQPA